MILWEQISYIFVLHKKRKNTKESGEHTMERSLTNYGYYTYNITETKVFEVKDTIAKGCSEVDMVINIRNIKK